MSTLALRQTFRIALIVLMVLVGSWSLTAPRTTAASSTTFTVYLPLVMGQNAAPVSSASPLEQEVVDLTNQLRQAHGCPPLTLSVQLSDAARGHSADMALKNFLSHTGSDGSTVTDRYNQVGYSYTQAAENIAAGQVTARAVVDSWYASEGHRRNMLNCALTDIGVGYAENTSSSYGIYWTQDFGSR